MCGPHKDGFVEKYVGNYRIEPYSEAREIELETTVEWSKRPR